ncbi:hypothetical protein [uncultured Megasphaera sp.]|nr:hypothetical protein [uncultured Megasphaera sp.]
MEIRPVIFWSDIQPFTHQKWQFCRSLSQMWMPLFGDFPVVRTGG